MQNIHAKATRTWKGKKFFPPLKDSQNFFPPALRGCPCGDFPPPIWNFQDIFLFSSPLKISYIKKFNKLSWKRHGKIFYPPQNELKFILPLNQFQKNFPCGKFVPPPLATCLSMYDLYVHLSTVKHFLYVDHFL